MAMADEQLISLQPGTVIAGRYEVVKCLGAGSVGLVYACRHRDLPGHLVAVKVLFPEVAQDRVAAARFRNEIIASYGVSHPNVVRAYEYLRDGDLVAYTMEYVDGGALVDRLEKGAPKVPIAEAVRLLAQMCGGVQAIHDAGIVHRDLKPENILLTRDGNVKIADFGIARTGHGPRLTEHGGVVGTIDYVSPEYMLNSQVDWRSDIYALGILAYEMVTGESPFRGDSVYATMTKRLKSDAQPPSTLRSECPAGLDHIILRAMARDPEERYQSAAEIFLDLKNLMPDVVLTSGASPQLPNRNSGAYVGPTVPPQTPRADSPNGGSEPQGRIYGVVNHPTATRNDSHEIGSLQREGELQSEAGDQGQSSYERPLYEKSRENAQRHFQEEDNSSPSEPELQELAPHVPTRHQLTPRHERSPRSEARRNEERHARVELSTSLRDSQGETGSDPEEKDTGRWLPPSRGGEFSSAREGIHPDRMKRLTEMADTGEPSILGDIAFIAGAAIVGALFGFVVLMAFFPELLQKNL